MRDEKVREILFRLELVHQVEHLRADGNVQRGDRLVRHDQLRVTGVVGLVQHALLDNVRHFAVKLLSVFHHSIPAAYLYISHHAAHDLFNIPARTSRTGFHFADNALFCCTVRRYYI